MYSSTILGAGRDMPASLSQNLGVLPLRLQGKAVLLLLAVHGCRHSLSCGCITLVSEGRSPPVLCVQSPFYVPNWTFEIWFSSHLVNVGKSLLCKMLPHL
jgi:hypothetical protein